MTVKSNFVINQGTTFKTYFEMVDVDGVPLNISGYTIVSSIKKFYTSNTEYPFTCAIEQAANGIFSLAMDENTTTSITSGRYVYDVKVTDSANVAARVLEGIITLSPEVTT